MSRNVLLAVFLAAIGLATGSAWFTAPAQPAKEEAASMTLDLAVLTQAQGPKGMWRVVSTDGMLPEGSELQLHFRVSATSGYLLVVDLSAGEGRVLYPSPLQTGALRRDVMYSLPDPRKTYSLEPGEVTRIVVLHSRTRLPPEEEGRVRLAKTWLRSAPASTPTAAVDAVDLPLRDGRTVSIPFRRAIGRYVVGQLVELSLGPGC